MAPGTAAVWIAPPDEVVRGNLLGAAMVTVEREGLAMEPVIEGVDRYEEAVAAGRAADVLIVPELDQVLPDPAAQLELVELAQAEGWRLVMLTLGGDSTARSGELIAAMLRALIATPVGSDAQPTPSGALRRRVSVGTDSTFHRSGLMHVNQFAASLAAEGVRLDDARQLLDWGAGCGRMTYHLLSRAPAARVTAADTDAEAIAWVGENLAVAAAVALPLVPPSSLADDSFDLVVGHSVFSHLNVEAQDLWLAELARITRPGGHVAVSFNGPVALAWHLEHPLVDVPDSVGEAFERDGISVWGDDGWEDEFYDGYHTTFTRHEYLREHWSNWFDVVAIDEAGALPVQDIAILRGR
ncbi:MAG: methyltransferase domain-containing protein [Actinobacteria bacterium]|nr:methyltransferase domain-containing protein [Actinomycetota bacterium]